MVRATCHLDGGGVDHHFRYALSLAQPAALPAGFVMHQQRAQPRGQRILAFKSYCIWTQTSYLLPCHETFLRLVSFGTHFSLLCFYSPVDCPRTSKATGTE